MDPKDAINEVTKSLLRQLQNELFRVEINEVLISFQPSTVNAENPHKTEIKLLDLKF